MKKSICQILVILSLTALIGCEWEWGGDDADWDDSWNWMNFSATYRGTGGNLVREFSTTGSGSGGGDGGTTGVEGTAHVETGQNLDIYSAGETSPDGELTPEVDPGTVTLVFKGISSGATIGTFSDNGGGMLSGYYTVDPFITPNLPATGQITYETGKWFLNLQSGGLFEDAQLEASWVWIESATNTVIEEPDDDTDDAGTVASIYSFTVTQSGNQLYFTDSNGDTYEGTAWAGAFPGGDETGGTSGDVTMNFSVSGKSKGDSVTITGTFSGDWAAPAGEDEDASQYGNMTGRIIDGTWTEDNGTADVRGAATSD